MDAKKRVLLYILWNSSTDENWHVEDGETAKKTKSKKSEISDASALDLDSDSQPIPVASIAQPIAQQLITIQQTLNTLLTEISGIHTQV